MGTPRLGAPKWWPQVGSITERGKGSSISFVEKGPGDLLVVNQLHLLVPVLLFPCLISFAELCSVGDLLIYMCNNHINTLTTIEPIKVDLEALAQAQKVGEALGSMDMSEPAERAALEMEQLGSFPYKRVLLAAGFLLAAAALAYRSLNS